MKSFDQIYMLEALKEARLASIEGEVPIGCIIVKDNRIIARAHNQKEKLNDPITHAEIIAISKASSLLNNWRLSGCTIILNHVLCVHLLY